MGYRATQYQDDIQYKINSYIADTEEDMNNIPLEDCDPGSTCIVIEDSAVFMLNTNKEWKEL